MKERVAAYREENGLAKRCEGSGGRGHGFGVPASTRTSRWRTRASRRTGWRMSAGSPLAEVNQLIDENTDGRSLGFLGEPGVNVLELNVALDQSA